MSGTRAVLHLHIPAFGFQPLDGAASRFNSLPSVIPIKPTHSPRKSENSSLVTLKSSLSFKARNINLISLLMKITSYSTHQVNKLFVIVRALLRDYLGFYDISQIPYRLSYHLCFWPFYIRIMYYLISHISICLVTKYLTVKNH